MIPAFRHFDENKTYFVKLLTKFSEHEDSALTQAQKASIIKAVDRWYPPICQKFSNIVKFLTCWHRLSLYIVS